LFCPVLLISLCLVLVSFSAEAAKLVDFKDSDSLLTSTWASKGTLQIAISNAYAFDEQYQYDYLLSGWWDNLGRDDEPDGSNSVVKVKVVTATPPAPTVPLDVAAVSRGVGQIGITWSVSSDDSDDVSDISYNIYRDGTLLDSCTYCNGYPDTGLEPETEYTYTVSAVDSEGNESVQSVSVSAATSALPDLINPDSDIMPVSRIGDWTNAGVEGGIPDYAIGVNAAVYGAVGDGVTDDTAAINAAITACPDNCAVLLPAGDYYTAGALVLSKPVVLRGEGIDSTRIIHDHPGNAIRFESGTEFAGIEDLHIETVYAFVRGGGYKILLYSVENCWAKNIETSGYCGHAVLLDGSSHCEIRDSYIHNSAVQTVDDADPDNHADAYGIEIYGREESSHNLVENNVLDWFRHALILQWSCNNNVYAYNFAWTNWSREYSVTTDFELHHTPYSPMNMAHSIAYTLVEGNSLEQPGSQNASHRNNTWFRNRVVNSGINMNTNNFALGNELTTKKNPDATTSGSWANYISGIKGTSVAHGNYITDPPTGPGLFWDDSIVDHDIPDSFYLDAKPDWFGDLAWPPFGGDLMPGNTNRSPAEVRFWSMQFPEEAPSGLLASISGSDVALSWSSNSTNEVDFIVCRSSDNGEFERIAVAAGTTYTDTVADDGQYCYYVRAMNYLGGVNGDAAGGESGPSNVLCVAVGGSASSDSGDDSGGSGCFISTAIDGNK
jgi:hypothetical protein